MKEDFLIEALFFVLSNSLYFQICDYAVSSGCFYFVFVIIQSFIVFDICVIGETSFWVIIQFLTDKHINDVAYVYECAFGFTKQV